MGLYRLLRPYVRSLGVIDPAHESVASSAAERHQQMPTYTSPGLVAYLDHAHQVTQVFDHEHEKYSVATSGAYLPNLPAR
jgi:hypothetical protein